MLTLSIRLPLLVLSAAAIAAGSPLARIHVKFAQPPHHVQEHGITTDGGRLLSQQSYLSIGRRSPNFAVGNPPVRTTSNYNPRVYQQQPRYLPPRPVSYEPVVVNDITVGTREYNHPTPDFTNGLDYPDPLLLTGEAAMLAVRYIYGRGELFFQDIPHTRSVLRNQEERLENGLHGNILRSIRPGSPWNHD